MSDKYKLNERGEPVRVEDLMEWATAFEKQRQVRLTSTGKVIISTVFLGLDHQWGEGPPILWETMVFGGVLDQEQMRCSGSREQALAMHSEMVERVASAEILDSMP